MSNAEFDLEQIELSINEAKEIINRKEMLDRLTNNKDFRALIIDGYFTKEAARLVQNKPYAHNSEMKEDIEANIDAIGFFRMYLNGIDQMGITALRSLEADEATREEILAEAV